MKYVQPIGGAADDPYIDANPGGGIEGSAVPAAAIEDPMRELVALIQAAGITPDDAVLNQVAKAVQSGKLMSAVAAGTANALTAAFSPTVTDLSNGLQLYIRSASANITTTPTFKADGMAAKAIVKGNNLSLVAGDIAGAGHWIALQFDTTLDKWVLQNPANGVNSLLARQVQSLTASVAANALTLGLNPTSLDFRASPLTSGVPNTRPVSAALSLVVPSGATLGTISGQAARLVLLAIDNAGTVELAVVNLSGGVNLGETTLISTTAISAAATSAGVIYSTSARASVPFRVVGFVDITEAAAGTWSTAPAVVQGHGGQALASLSAIGYGQAWVDVTASRALGTTYYNTTGKPIAIQVTTNVTGGGTQGQLFINGVSLSYVNINTGNNVYVPHFGIVPPGSSYSAVGGSLSKWVELR